METTYRPGNPALLIGHSVVFTAEAVATVPAYGDTVKIHQITQFCGVVGGEPYYMVAPMISGGGVDLENERDVFLSEFRVVGTTFAESQDLIRAGLVDGHMF